MQDEKKARRESVTVKVKKRPGHELVVTIRRVG